VDDCDNDAFFQVAVYNEDSERLDDHLDVCGAAHAAKAVKDWLKTLADVIEEVSEVSA
jgi:hypothetical protein